ncbi:MAG: DUF799 family lipoprotein [Candidatus Cloacimonetes bacterium]|nr:DUF799 family lipoprotein [Candidatus Cloacimonadota bacterium]
MKRRTIISSTLLAVLLLITACAPPPLTLRNAFPKMYDNPPTTILILPPINKSTAADAKEYFACSLSEAIGMKGYYPMPVEATFGVLRDEGLYDTENINPAVLSNFKQHFGVDAVLVTSIEEWEKSYAIVSGSLTIKAKFALLSTANADTLWDFTTKTVVTLESDNDNFLVALLETAVKTAVEDYFPNCQKANIMTMEATLPYGKHHPVYGNDGDKTIPASKYAVIQISK